MTDFDIVNVVGWISYRQEFALAAFAETFSERDEVLDVTYDPSQNHWLQTHFSPHNTYVAFYRSGRCSITGVKSIEAFQEIVEQVNNVMRDILNFSYEPESEITNIVATADSETEIPLEILTLELGVESVEYEPEQFPGLIYRKDDHVILVFASGKVICTGLTDLEEIDRSLEEIICRVQNIK